MPCEFGSSRLIVIEEICSRSHVQLRPDDGHQIHIETAPEAIRGWREDWKVIKNDPIRRADLKLDPPEIITADNIETWVARLDDPDKRVCWVARMTLREMPDGLLARFEQLAVTQAALDLRDLLRLRSKGTILFNTSEIMGESLWVTNGDGSSLRRISGNVHDLDSRPVPGRGGMVYATAGPPGGPHRILKLRADGTRTPEVVLENASITVGGVQTAPWLILYRSGGNFAWNAETGATMDLPAASVTAFAWSPKGEFACAGACEGSSAVWIGAPGGELRRIADLPAACSVLAWSPSGKDLLCQTKSSRSVDAELSLLDLKGGSRRVLRKTGHDPDAPGWSPDGTTIACSAGRMQGGMLLGIDGTEIGTFDKDLPPAFSRSPCWSPDGTKLCLFGSPGNGPGLWTVDRATLQSCHVQRASYFAQWSLTSDWYIQCSGTDLWLISSAGDGRRIRVTDAVEDVGVCILPIPASR